MRKIINNSPHQRCSHVTPGVTGTVRRCTPRITVRGKSARRLAPVTPGVTGEHCRCAPAKGNFNTGCYRQCSPVTPGVTGAVRQVAPIPTFHGVYWIINNFKNTPPSKSRYFGLDFSLPGLLSVAFLYSGDIFVPCFTLIGEFLAL